MIAAIHGAEHNGIALFLEFRLNRKRHSKV